MKLRRYRGHLYRLAGRLRLAQDPGEEVLSEAPADAQLAKLGQLGQDYLRQYGLVGAMLTKQPKPEADGRDVVFSVGQKWPGITALLTFDYTIKGDSAKLVELVLELCGSFYVAHGDREIKSLLSSLGTLSKSDFHPEQPQEVVQDKRKTQYLKFLEHYIGEMLRAGVELPDADYSDREQFIKAIKQMAAEEALPSERAKDLIDGAELLTDDEWQELIDRLESPGQRYMTKQYLADRAVRQLTAHEHYTGDAQIIGASPEGEIVVGLEVPPPVQSLVFAFKHQAGTRQLLLQDAALGLCDAFFVTGNNVALTKQLVSAMVDLVAASEVAQDPELSKPPTIERAPAWTEERLKVAMEKGLVVWETQFGLRAVWRNNPLPCWSEEEWDEQLQADNTTFKNYLSKAQKAKAKVFKVDSEGRVDQMDYNFRPIAQNIARFNQVSQQIECPVR